MKSLKDILIIGLIGFVSITSYGQDMNILKMDEIIHNVADSVVGENGVWQLKYQESFMMILTDEQYNRMRIITPIIDQTELKTEDMVSILEANYHSALDTKYALSDGILWAVFIHPLQELSEKQFINAISQVYYSAATFGSTYSSTGLSFGGKETPVKDGGFKRN